MVWKDITTEFKQNASKIPLGQLVHNPHFDLMAAVFSITIMDPRIDSGVFLADPIERGKLATVPELGVKDLVGIMDSLIQMKIDHFDGKLLTSTVYASIFVRNRRNLESDILKYFISLLIYSLNLMRGIVIDTALSFEEDFFPKTYDCDLEQELVQDHDILSRLSTCNRESFMEIDSVNIDGVDFQVYANALVSRLEFMREWGTVVTAIQDLDHCTVEKSVKKCLDLLVVIQSTISLGNDMISSLDVLVHRLKFPTYQLYPVELNIAKAIQDWERMLLGIQDICVIVNQSCFNTILLDLNDFHHTHPNSNIYVRTYLFNSILNEDQFLGRESLGVEIEKSIHSFYPIPYQQHQNVEVARIYRQIIQQYHELFSNLLKIMCINRARQRRQLIHFLKELDAVKQGILDAETAMHNLCDPRTEVLLINKCPFYLFRWSYFYKLQLNIFILHMGFDLELYARHEFTAVYCYTNYICNVMNQHVQVIKEKEMVARMSIISLHSSNQKHPFMDQMESIFIYLQSMNSISFKLSVLLTRIHPSFRMDKPYYNPQIAYQHRFSVFLQQQLPTPLPYKEYHRVFNQLLTCPMKVLVQSCLESIETAKNAIELLKKRNPELKKEIQNGMRVCVANRLVLTTTDWGDVTMDAEFKYHSLYLNLVKLNK